MERAMRGAHPLPERNIETYLAATLRARERSVTAFRQQNALRESSLIS